MRQAKPLLCRGIGVLLVFGVSVSLLGCGGPKLAPVSGLVTLDGKPLSSGVINFIPDKAKGNSSPGGSSAMVKSDGAYELFWDGKKGVPLGWYKVTVSLNAPPSDMELKPGAPAPKMDKSTVQNKYGNVESTNLTVEVVSSPAPGAYDFKLTR